MGDIISHDLHLSSSRTFHDSRIVMDGFEGKRWITALAYLKDQRKTFIQWTHSSWDIYIYIYFNFLMLCQWLASQEGCSIKCHRILGSKKH
jgi:hypothetical protein